MCPRRACDAGGDATPAPSPRAAHAGRAWPTALLLAVLVFAVFAPAARNGFTNFDDDIYIYENPQVRLGLGWGTAFWALTSTEHANWYPLRRLSHLVDASLFGMWAGGHHLVSAGWHAAAAALLFVALRLLTGAHWRSLAVAALFGVHPLQVESVAWAAERSNVLAGFFFALTLLLWARYARRPGAGRYAVALGAGALGLAAKTVLITLPVLLLLLDAWPLGRLAPPGAAPWRWSRRRLGRSLLEQVPLLALAAVSGAAALAMHHQAGAVTTLEAFPAGIRVGSMALSVWGYLGNLLWPQGLAVFYPHLMNRLPVGKAVLAGLLLAALSALFLAQARRRPWLGTGWLWFLVMLAPMSGIVQFGRHAMADRFVYLSSAGVFLALAWQTPGFHSAPRAVRSVVGAAVGLAVLAAAAISVAQIGYWRDDGVLWQRALQVTRWNFVAHNNLGTFYLRKGRLEDARREFLAAVETGSNSAGPLGNLGVVYSLQGRLEEAAAAFQEAQRWGPLPARAHRQFGTVLASFGRWSEASAAFREALRLEPGDPQTLYLLGVSLAQEGEYEKSVRALEGAAGGNPRNETFRAALAVAREQLRRSGGGSR